MREEEMDRYGGRCTWHSIEREEANILNPLQTKQCKEDVHRIA